MRPVLDGQRTLKDLDRAASTLATVCRMLLDPSLPDGEVRERVYAAIGHDELTQALNDITSLVRPSDDVFYTELAAKQATVTRFFPTLLRVIQFDANPAARPLVAAEVGGTVMLIDAKTEALATWYASYGAMPLLDAPLTLVLPLDVVAAALKAAEKGEL